MGRILPLLPLLLVLGGVPAAVPVSAKEGACCFPPCYDCIVTTEEACNQQGGYFLGENTTCDPNP